MKVIDLLNTIANGELKFEQKFEHNGVISDMEMFSNKYLLNEEILNNKIEIIEEEQDIEELDTKKTTDFGAEYVKENRNKINELIKAVNELKNKG